MEPAHRDCRRCHSRRALVLSKTALFCAIALFATSRGHSSGAFVAAPRGASHLESSRDSQLQSEQLLKSSAWLAVGAPLPAIAEPIVYEDLEVDWVEFFSSIPIIFYAVFLFGLVVLAINAVVPPMDTDAALIEARLKAPDGMTRFQIAEKEEEERKALKEAKASPKYEEVDPWGKGY
mmetsp:Transcript_57054/g.105481  ORF Transcript_57054/g.105481 Transcript_57054/m.105481 type:complete len:178 (+) Transcript_57054:101-634(+)